MVIIIIRDKANWINIWVNHTTLSSYCNNAKYMALFEGIFLFVVFQKLKKLYYPFQNVGDNIH